MALFGKLFSRQLSSVIEWQEQDPSILFFRYQGPTDEIKNSSKLVLNPGQGCILVYEGKVIEVLTEERVYNLTTDNHPFITTLSKLSKQFESEHKMYLYFYRKAELYNQKWGTSAPVKYLDSQYRFPVELGAHGNYSLKVADAASLLREVIGSKTRFTASDIQQLLTSRLTTIMTSYLAQSAYSCLQIDANLDKISTELQEKLNQTFSALGLQLTDFRLEGTSFDKNTRDRINKIANMTAEAQAASEGGLTYEEMERLKALRDVARNEGGLAGAGLQIGAGLEIGKSFAEHKAQPTPATASVDPVEQLKSLKTLLDQQILTPQEFEAKKKEILSRM